MKSASIWHPVGLSHSLETASSAGTRIDGAERVVWRDNSGVAHVWEDRCPHRGMRLSFGFVRGDHIACLYHGWQYDTGGQCQYIPAHPDLEVPKTIKVPVYRTIERAGMIWTALAEDTEDMVLTEAPGATVPLRSLHVDCAMEGVMAVLEAVPLTPFAAAGTQETTISRLSSNLYAVSSGQDRVLVGIQPVTATRLALHIVIAGLPEVYLGGGQAHFLRWAMALRHRFENPQKPAFTGVSAAERGAR